MKSLPDMGGSALKTKFDLKLYVLTDRSFLDGERLEDKVKQIIAGGATIIQLREKNISSREFLETAINIRKITSDSGIPMIINDRLDIALASDADGLHVGQDDMPARIARRILGNNKILGVSASNVSEAIQAELDGADYIGVGAIFPTDSKNDARYVTISELVKITETVSIPVVAIGGINENNALSLEGTRVSGIAVISAIFSKRDVRGATQNMRKLVDAITSKEKGL